MQASWALDIAIDKDTPAPWANACDLDPARSDADLLVAFEPRDGNDPYEDLKAELERVLKRPVDLLERQALDESRNCIRRMAILHDAETVYES